MQKCQLDYEIEITVDKGKYEWGLRWEDKMIDWGCEENYRTTKRQIF